MKRIIPFLFIFMFLFSCSNSTDTDKEYWIGRYEATKFFVVDTSENINMDIIQAGANFDINLKTQNQFNSSLFLPESLAQKFLGEEVDSLPPGDITINVNGTYELKGQNLKFKHEEDFFMRDLDNWKLIDDKIICKDSVGGVQVVNGTILILPLTSFDIEMIKTTNN